MLRIFAALVMLVQACTMALAFDATEVKSPGGITAWLVQDSTIPLIALDFAFASGSATDPADKEGTAHFLTGLMDEGAADIDGPTFQALREKLAMRLSFNTSADHFQGSLQTLTKNKEEAFALLAKALNDPKFPPEAIERMRQNFIVSANAEEQDPQTMVFRAWTRLTMAGHPYTRATHGTPKSLVNITRDDLIKSYKAIFSRRDLKIAVVGDISPIDLARLLDKTFGTLPDTPPVSTIPEAKIATGPAKQIIAFNNPQTFVVFGNSGIKYGDKDYFAAVVMSQILGGSKSWLNDEVREKRGLTYGISYDLMPMKHAGLYVGSFSTVNEKAGEAMAITREVITRMATQGPSQQEMDDAKTYLTGSYALRFDSSEKIADHLLFTQLGNRAIDYAKYRNSLVEAVTLDQVKVQAKRLLAADKLIVVAAGKPDGL